MTKKYEELVEEIRLVWCKDCGDGPSRCEYSPDLDDDACEGGVVTIKLCRERARECVTHVLSAFHDGRLGQFKEVLERMEHELTTLHGLIVCDGFKAYHEAQRAGADAEGAWNSFVEETWQIDTGEALGVIRAALRPLTGTGKEDDKGTTV